MDVVLGYALRFAMYVMLGITLETLFSVSGIDHALGYRVERRVPRKYLEGFVSVYMIPLHGFGLLFLFEPLSLMVRDWPLPLRFAVYAACFSLCEVVWGWTLDKVVGFYTWDYYAKSRYRVFRRGYTLWTLVPLWGVAGLIIEPCSRLALSLTPHAVAFLLNR